MTSPTHLAAEDENKKNAVLKQEDLQDLKVWLETQRHLPPITDEQLTLFLHSCYYDLKSTMDCIETYFTLRTKAPEFFTHRDLQQLDLQKSIGALQYAIMPTTDPDGNCIIFHGLQQFEPSRYSFCDGVKLLIMTIDVALQTHGTMPGFVLLFDMKGVRLGHLTKLSLSAIRKLFLYVQEGMPVRLKAIHVINVVSFMDKVMSVIKPFMKKELFSLLHLHSGSVEHVYKYLPPSCLPKDFGGELPPMCDLHVAHVKQLESFREYFEEEEKFRVDESKRNKKNKGVGMQPAEPVSLSELSID